MKEEEWEEICRICLKPEKPDQPLRHPFPCRGSIKYVHAKCLLFWLNHSGLDSCEICRGKYRFGRVHSKNANKTN